MQNHCLSYDVTNWILCKQLQPLISMIISDKCPFLSTELTEMVFTKPFTKLFLKIDLNAMAELGMSCPLSFFNNWTVMKF